MWLVFAVGSAVFAGITSILAKMGLKKVDSYVATALRTVVVLIFAWIMVFLVNSQNQLKNISPKNLLFLTLSGFTTGASWLCYFRALQIGDVNKVVPIDKSSTILTMLLAFFILHEPITKVMLFGMLLIGIGTYLMIQKKEGLENKNNYKQSFIIYAFLSAIFASLTAILGKLGIQQIESNLGSALRTIVVLFMAWLIVILQKKVSEVSKIDKKSWVYILLSGIATGASWLCYYRALQEGPASIIVPIDKLSILVVILFASVFLKEHLPKRAMTGLVLLVAGTLILLIK